LSFRDDRVCHLAGFEPTILVLPRPVQVPSRRKRALGNSDSAVARPAAGRAVG
jgi:hypothetical protein